MPQGIYQEGIRADFLADKTVGNTVTETSIVPTLSVPSIVNQMLRQANASLGTPTQLGTKVVYRGWGYLSSVATHTLQLKCKNNSTVVASGTSPALPALTNELVYIEIEETFRSTGAGGTAVVGGLCRITMSATGASIEFPIITTSPQTSAQNVNLVLDWTATWSTAAAGSTLTIFSGSIHLLNSM